MGTGGKEELCAPCPKLLKQACNMPVLDLSSSEWVLQYENQDGSYRMCWQTGSFNQDPFPAFSDFQRPHGSWLLALVISKPVASYHLWSSPATSIMRKLNKRATQAVSSALIPFTEPLFLVGHIFTAGAFLFLIPFCKEPNLRFKVTYSF